MRTTMEAWLPGPRGPAAAVRLLQGLASDPCPTLDRAAARYGPTFSVGHEVEQVAAPRAAAQG